MLALSLKQLRRCQILGAIFQLRPESSFITSANAQLLLCRRRQEISSLSQRQSPLVDEFPSSDSAQLPFYQKSSFDRSVKLAAPVSTSQSSNIRTGNSWDSVPADAYAYRLDQSSTTQVDEANDGASQTGNCNGCELSIANGLVETTLVHNQNSYPEAFGYVPAARSTAHKVLGESAYIVDEDTSDDGTVQNACSLRWERRRPPRRHSRSEMPSETRYTLGTSQTQTSNQHHNCHHRALRSPTRNLSFVGLRRQLSIPNCILKHSRAAMINFVNSYSTGTNFNARRVPVLARLGRMSRYCQQIQQMIFRSRGTAVRAAAAYRCILRKMTLRERQQMRKSPFQRKQVLSLVNFLARKAVSAKMQVPPEGSKKLEKFEHVYPIKLNSATILSIVQTLRNLRESGLPDEVGHGEASGDGVFLHKARLSKPRAWLQAKSRFLQHEFAKRKGMPRSKAMWSQRTALPIMQKSMMEQILKLIHANDVVVLVSETGSGKSTQLPQIILDSEMKRGRGGLCRILCSQPRRIAATSVAARVAAEQNTPIGEGVGYAVRFSAREPRSYGSISYLTAGVLLRRMGDGLLDQYSHFLIDEVHERDLATDLSLASLRDLLYDRKAARKRTPKVILMSATIDALAFEKYFSVISRGIGLKVAIIDIEGRKHSVDDHTLEEYLPKLFEYEDGRAQQLLNTDKDFIFQQEAYERTLGDRSSAMATSRITSSRHPRARRKVRIIAARRAQKHHMTLQSKALGRPEEVPVHLICLTIAHILLHPDGGDVLVFLPGMNEITKVKSLLEDSKLIGLDLADANKYRILRLHAALYETNPLVFEPVPPGCRRIVLSTNIGQTSVTLPDVVHVVDAGRQRYMNLDQTTGIEDFVLSWIDKAASLQRKGRAGRTRPGHYWTIFTRSRLQNMRPRPIPEIKNVDLAAACVQIKAQNENRKLASFLANTLDPPDEESVKTVTTQLEKLGIFDNAERLTSLGRLASCLPIHPAMARGLFLGLLFRCFQPLLIIASHNPDKPLIHSPVSLSDSVTSKAAFAALADDDRFAFVEAFRRYDKAIRDGDLATMAELETCSVKRESYGEMLNIGKQICKLMADFGIFGSSTLLADDFVQGFPESLNENMDTTALIKAIAVCAMHTKLAVNNSDARSFLAKQQRSYLSSSSVNSNRIYQAQGRVRLAKEHGQLIAYSNLVRLPDSTHPHLTETSSITPLMAMMFGAPIRQVGDHVIELDGWLQYRIDIETEADDASVGAWGITSAASVVLELRKALDRFIALACSDLPKRRRGHGPDHDLTQAGKQPDPEPMALDASGPISDAMVRGMAEIMRLDAHYWDMKTQQALPQSTDTDAMVQKMQNRELQDLHSQPSFRRFKNMSLKTARQKHEARS